MESTTSIQENRKAMAWKNPIQRMLDNPVILKELRGRMRNRQAFTLLTFYLGLIAVFITVIYSFIAEQSSFTAWDPSFRQAAGKAIFGTVVLLEILLISFIAPALTSGTITSERERQTFDLLRTTLLSAQSFVLGKLGSAFAYLLLLILTTLPIQSLAFLLGGVGIGEMVASSLMLIVTALFFCSLGIFFSSFMKRSVTATVTSNVTIILSYVLIVVILIFMAYVESVSSQATRVVLVPILWFLISTNPLLAAIISETILVDQHSLFVTNQSFLGSGGPAQLLSPWIIYVAFYTFLTFIFVLLSIYNVKRPDR